jgi:hypothetical protein
MTVYLSFDPTNADDVVFVRQVILQETAKRNATVTPIKAPAKPAPKADVTASRERESKTGGKLDYEKDVKPLALQLSRNPVLRPKLIAIYDEFGVSVGSELKADQLAAAKEKIQDVLDSNV